MEKAPPTLEPAKILEETPNVDLAVMLDCTGSMGSFIHMCQNKIKIIISQVNESYCKSEIRISIIAYRDINDKKRFEILPFTLSPNEAKSFLDKLKANGGEDTPEDVNGAFQHALFDIEWKSSVRLLVHIADAPCHGKKFHNCDDSFPNGGPNDISWEKIFERMFELRIDYLFLKVLDITDLMFKLFNEIAKKKGFDKAGLTFNQESIKDESENLADKMGHEERIALKISEKVKSCVEKELKKCFENRLEKRTKENASLVEKTKQSISEIVQKYDFEILKKKYATLSAQVGECILSSNNFIEALVDEDCLCLTFNIGRSQAAIVDPSQVIIKDVFPSFLTVGSFFYSTEFALKKNKLAHGGYIKNADGLIIKGAAQEDITGVLPLYICEENWKVAKNLMKLAVGWAVTLEPAGYTYSQVKIVPFLILAKVVQKLHEQPDSEFLKFQLALVKETCIQIMKDGSRKDFAHKFDEEVVNFYSNYVKKTSLRTVDSIPNNIVFLAQLYTAKECGIPFVTEDKYFDIFIRGILEEELRRTSYPLDEKLNKNQWILDVLNVNVEKLIDEPLNKFRLANSKKTNPIYEQLFLSKLSQNEKEEITKVKEIEEIKCEKEEEENKTTADFESYDFKRGNSDFNSIQRKAIEELHTIFKKIIEYLYPLIKAINGKEIKDPTKMVSWGIDNDSKLFTLYIQNKLQTKNSKRRKNFENEKHRDPWTADQEYIKNLYIKTIEKEKIMRMNDFLIAIKGKDSDEKASIFAHSDNLEEAAGCLIGTTVGNIHFMYFFKEICKGESLLVKDKMRMLVSGMHRGVQLYSGWNIGKKNSNRFKKAYFSE